MILNKKEPLTFHIFSGKWFDSKIKNAKSFSAAEEGFISETHENLCCLQSLLLLLTNLEITEKKKLCFIAAKVYLMRWRIEEYFKFKKQQFELED